MSSYRWSSHRLSWLALSSARTGTTSLRRHRQHRTNPGTRCNGGYAPAVWRRAFSDISGTLGRSAPIKRDRVCAGAADPGATSDGSLRFIGSGGGFRWVMATVDAGTSRLSAVQENRVKLTATLGHELQHAREVSDARAIWTAAEFESTFERGHWRPSKHTR